MVLVEQRVRRDVRLTAVCAVVDRSTIAAMRRRLQSSTPLADAAQQVIDRLPDDARLLTAADLSSLANAFRANTADMSASLERAQR